MSDRGPQFTSHVWESFMEKLGITVSLTSGYHPQANGQVERANQEIGRFLRTFCSTNPEDWSRFLPWAEYVKNSLRHSATQLTPFQCVLGFQRPLLPWNDNPTDSPSVDDWFSRVNKYGKKPINILNKLRSLTELLLTNAVATLLNTNLEIEYGWLHEIYGNHIHVKKN